MSVSKYTGFLEIYNLDSYNIIYNYINKTFSEFHYFTHQIGAHIKLSSSENNYLIGIMSDFYNNYGQFIENRITLIKFSITSITDKLRTSYSSTHVTGGDALSISCYETSSKYIVCFYKNKDNKFTMGVFSYTPNLSFKIKAEIAAGNNNKEIYYKCIHFFEDTGAFIYYLEDSHNHKVYANIEFRKYCSNNIYPYLSKIKLEEYDFSYKLNLNDIIKISDKKIYFAAIMNNDIYITYICNYDQEKMIQRIYQINSLTTNNYYIDFMIKIHIFNNYLLLGSNGFTNEEESFSSLIIFSYPNMEDRNIELSDYLLNHNEVNINNFTLELNNLCIVENNIFGFLLKI